MTDTACIQLRTLRAIHSATQSMRMEDPIDIRSAPPGHFIELVASSRICLLVKIKYCNCVGAKVSSAQRTVTSESGLFIKMALYSGAMPRSHKRRMHPNPASMPSIGAL